MNLKLRHMCAQAQHYTAAQATAMLTVSGRIWRYSYHQVAPWAYKPTPATRESSALQFAHIVDLCCTDFFAQPHWHALVAALE